MILRVFAAVVPEQGGARGRERAQLRSAAFIAAILVGCGSASPLPSGALIVADRPSCPGSIPRVFSNLTGEPADLVERGQAELQDEEGFRALVYDGKQAVVVVTPDTLDDWVPRVAQRGLGLGTSCVDEQLLGVVQKAFGTLTVQSDDVIGVGYSGLNDAIFVSGVDEAQLRQAILMVEPGFAAKMDAAIAAGTLRLR